MAQLASTQNQFMIETRRSLQNHYTQLRSLEILISQLANLFSNRQKGNLPSTSKVNPMKWGKEHCKTITLRSGKSLEKPVKVE